METLTRPVVGRSAGSTSEPVRAGTLQAFQAETHSEINELENSVTRLETQLVSVMSPSPPGKPGSEAQSVGGACEVASSAHSAALRVAAVRERIEAILNRLQIA